MDFPAFLKLVESTAPAKDRSEATLRLWHHIFYYVLRNDYADTADSPEFVKYVQDFRAISVSTINSHLRKMSEAKLLKACHMRRKLDQGTKELILNPMAFWAYTDLPTGFKRYCLPDSPCSGEFKSAERARERAIRGYHDMVRRREEPGYILRMP